ncbi:phosphonate C-P lyase system protein PhnG [Rhizobium herbae]|uniref:Alpha-D-ribose 1-methylphosphonate 5-triphosphate synthase subunit PhnG n=1 Tax=Rhizobium herbae TaxID=508661 RepID=A0ABS4EKZ7_9HYPH|nr:phosphonate C-P lyase system protein PhnG [Rhizobium herbae]MBP1858619.1 alpha-D-ribose 1-methylphosphonate 5-triphosphate synthase subunit PhnG [Rhizobium herbae]
MDAIKQNIGAAADGRKRAMGLLARASAVELQTAWQAIEPKPEVHPVRGPESGLVMVRGRIGGGGDPFNLGEATVSRATVRLGSGEIGHGQLLGNDREKARLAAIFDALHQRSEYSQVVGQLIDAVESRIDAEDRRQAEETAATRVDFFTMVRGDN